MTTLPDHHSLRERKRLATMVAIENAATSLVLEHGYDAVTVDQICAHADVSKRTFFNYVPSKEAAVVGMAPETVPDDLRERFLAEPGPEIMDALLALYLDTYARSRSGDDAHTATLVGRRRDIVQQHPELGVTRMTANSRFQTELTPLVAERLERHPALRRLPYVPADDEARTSIALMAAAVSLGVTTWLARRSATFDDLDGDCATALGRLAGIVTPYAPTTAGRQS